MLLVLKQCLPIGYVCYILQLIVLLLRSLLVYYLSSLQKEKRISTHCMREAISRISPAIGLKIAEASMAFTGHHYLVSHPIQPNLQLTKPRPATVWMMTQSFPSSEKSIDQLPFTLNSAKTTRRNQIDTLPNHTSSLTSLDTSTLAIHDTQQVNTHTILPIKETLPSDCPPGGFLVCTPTPDTSSPATQPAQPTPGNAENNANNTPTYSSADAQNFLSQMELVVGVIGGAVVLIWVSTLIAPTVRLFNRIANAGGNGGGGGGGSEDGDYEQNTEEEQEVQEKPRYKRTKTDEKDTRMQQAEWYLYNKGDGHDDISDGVLPDDLSQYGERYKPPQDYLDNNDQ